MLVLGLVLTIAQPAAAPPGALRVRASAALVRCTAAAARAYRAATGARVEVDAGPLREGPDADVLVGFGLEMTRAVESGAAVDRTDTDLARVPWVLWRREGGTAGARSLAELSAAGVEVWALDGAAAAELRRALEGHAAPRLRVSDAAGLGQAPAALVPLSAAGAGERHAVDLPALVARAAVAAASRRPEDARALVGFLASEAGQAAFAACEEAP